MPSKIGMEERPARQRRQGARPAPIDPIRVLQGERDYQVTMVFEGWKAALAGKKNATFKTYPGMNHHFMSGKGPSAPKEHEEPNHVPEGVVADITAWVDRSP